MFGTDEHSKALMAQWTRSKTLRDPNAVIQLAKEKGLHMFKCFTLDAEMYMVDSGGKAISHGSLEIVAKFVDEYTIVSAL